jgi:hypothetical protein
MRWFKGDPQEEEMQRAADAPRTSGTFGMQLRDTIGATLAAC